MIRGSTWKGSLLDTASKILKEKMENGSSTIEEIIDLYIQVYRIFGTGSEEFRNLKELLERYIEVKSGNSNISISELEKQLIKYALFDLGISLCLKHEEKSLINQIIELIEKEKMKSCDLDNISVRKGRAVFYPTFFNSM